MPYPWKFPIMTLEDLIAYKRRFHQLKSSKQKMTTLKITTEIWLNILKVCLNKYYKADIMIINLMACVVTLSRDHQLQNPLLVLRKE